MTGKRELGKQVWIAAAAAVLAALSVATLSSATVSAAEPTTSGGVITVGAEEFPPTLNNFSSLGNGQWTGMIVGPALARGYKLLPDFTYQPWLFDKDCAVVTQAPFTVSCTIRPDATWSDGVPITAADFEFTYDTIMNPKNDIVSRLGYEDITSFDVVSPTEFRMVFSQPFAPFRDLWAGTSTTVLPKHVLEGENFNKVWNTCICDPKTKKPIASGPMMVESFTPDRQATLVANPNYWGTKASVAKVVFVPTADSNSEINAFRVGEVDMIYPQNQVGLRKRIEVGRRREVHVVAGPAVGALRHALDGEGPRRRRGAQGDRDGDAAPADRRSSGEGRQRARRGARQRHVDDEPAAVRAELVGVPRVR